MKTHESKNAPSMKAVLREAVDYLAEDFENDEPIDGGDLVEWFCEWREEAKRALANQD